MRHAIAHWLSSLALLSSPTLAQTTYAVGVRDVTFANPTSQGSTTLPTRVLYPATVAGSNTPLLQQSGGWPAVTFLHGFALLGSSYEALGRRWAERGFVVALGNTAQFDNLLQEDDGRAMFAALQVANATPGGPFSGGIDLGRVGLAGHSMGGGNVANVLAANPGYRCGVAIAPVQPRGNNGALVTVPLGIIAGDGDTITPPTTTAVPYYGSLSAFSQLKLLYRLNGDASHTNLVGLFVFGTTATEVFARSASVALGFLQHTLDGDPTGLELALGDDALAEPRLVACERRFERAQAWAAADLVLGATVSVRAGLEPGIGGLVAAPGPLVPPLPTPFGELLLDPSTALVLQVGVVGAERRVDATIAVPADPSLVGAVVSLQAFGAEPAQPLSLGGAMSLVVKP